MSLEILRNKSEAIEARIGAAHEAGEIGEINDEAAGVLIGILHDRSEPDELRSAAAISLGPVLECCDLDGFEDGDDELFAPPISEATFLDIQKALRDVHCDGKDAKIVRRRALEAAVRAPAEWLAQAVRTAHASGDPEWKISGIFAMQYVPGFDREILEALQSPDAELRFEAIRAVGAREIRTAWPTIAKILTNDRADLDERLAAIEAAPGVDPENAKEVLESLATSDDAEISEAAMDALSYLGGVDSED